MQNSFLPSFTRLPPIQPAVGGGGAPAVCWAWGLLKCTGCGLAPPRTQGQAARGVGTHRGTQARPLQSLGWVSQLRPLGTGHHGEEPRGGGWAQLAGLVHSSLCAGCLLSCPGSVAGLGGPSRSSPSLGLPLRVSSASQPAPV